MHDVTGRQVVPGDIVAVSSPSGISVGMVMRLGKTVSMWDSDNGREYASVKRGNLPLKPCRPEHLLLLGKDTVEIPEVKERIYAR